MNYKLSAKIILLAILCLGLSLVSVSQDIIVMTYNIRYDNPGDSLNAWKYRKVKFCEQILAKNPGLLGVQEALARQLKDMDSLLPGYKHVGVGRDDGKDKGEYSAIFYKSAQYELLDGGTFWLSKSPEKPGSKSWHTACTRIVTWVKLKDRTNGAVFFHFNTHFDHMSALARKKSARLLKKRITAIAKDNAVIVTGDFNCSMQSSPMKILTRGDNHLKDSRTILGIQSNPQFTYSTFFVNGKHEGIIDHILTNDFFKVLTYSIPMDSDDGRYFSDHLPVVVKLKNTK